MSRKRDRRSQNRGKATWRGYAAFQRPDGGMIWGSLSLEADWSRQYAERHNPGVTTITVLPIRVIIGGEFDNKPGQD